MPPQKLKQAALALKFVVIGGSLAGLACGYALRTSGHEVVIIEQNASITKTDGSIRCPPNMTRILCRWPGMTEFFSKYATKLSGLSFRNGATSEPVGFMKFYRQIMSDLGAEFLVLQHNDLRRQLTSLCLAAGVDIKTGTAMNIKNVKEYQVHVTLENGSAVQGNIVIGADGHNSFVRSFVMPDNVEPENVATGVNISISMNRMLEHEEMRSLCEENQFTLWMGAGSSITGVLDTTRETFNLSLCTPTLLNIPTNNDWYQNHKVSDLPFDLSGYDPRLKRLIQLGHSCRPTIQQIFNLEDTVSLSGTIVLVGDAAHSASIHGSHNSSMAFTLKLKHRQIEDAVTLGALFANLSNREQIPVFLETFEELRQPRTLSTQRSEFQGLQVISLPSGEHQEGRDAMLRLTNDCEFEDFDVNAGDSDVPLVVQIWEEYLVLFNHDAVEVVENWWSKWGFML
ncbi:hypothetical protein GGX14DRAFT_538632 [Mycena pura]|uniref:FAD-binding domain-containing protein n=1 Tax=Mycena pura TaxID=153505 RepID=A0AAD6YSE9_9AGAR|nr:hypothetical protein GGX14DRAFT_538632 [Mycena pura]